MLSGDITGPRVRGIDDDMEEPLRPFLETAWQVLTQIRTYENLGTALPMVVQSIGNTLQADRCFIIEFEQQEPLPIRFEYRRHKGVASFKGVVPPWETCPYLQKTASRRFVAIPDISSDTSIDPDWQSFFKEHAIWGMIASPIVYGEKILQVLVIHTETPRPWQEDELAFVQFCSDQMAISLYQEEARKFQEKMQHPSSDDASMIENPSSGVWDWTVPTNTTGWNEKINPLQFSSTFAYASIGMSITELSGKLLKVNPSFCRILDYDEAALLGRNFRAITHPDDVEECALLVQQACAGIQPSFSIEKRYIKRDGTTLWAKTSVSLVRDDKGHPAHLIALVEDISERKKTEQALIESEERFRRMADSAPLFIWISNPLGRVHYVNKTWVDFLGMPMQDVIDFGMRAAVIPEDFESSQKAYRNAFSQQEPFSLECRLKRADGEVRWLLNQGAPLYFPNGDLAGYIGTSVDITERKEAEVQQQASLARERLMRQVVEIVNQSFDLGSILNDTARLIGQYFGTDRCYIIRYEIINNALSLNVFGEYCTPDTLSIDLSDFPPELLRSLTQDIPIQQIIQLQRYTNSNEYYENLKQRLLALPQLNPQEKAEYSDYFQQLLLEKYKINALLSTGIFYRSNTYGVISLHQCTPHQWMDEDVALLQDIATQIGMAFYQADLYYHAQATADKEQQARQELELYTKKLEISNRELAQFATIASHDLQEPLRKVQIFSQIVANDCIDEKSLDYINRMQGAVSRMQSLIHDLLALSRVSRQGQPFRNVDLNNCLEAALHDLEVIIQSLSPEFQIDPLMELDADPQQIEQLFLNLIGNALKFHQPDNRPCIRITGRQIGNQYEITIADNGIGFLEQYQERIFEPFARLHGHSQKYTGTGMGLAICRRIVERHNGTITAHSSEGEGATFVIILPLHQPQ
jgi:PAS domain S-box-containing protein